MLRLTKLEIRKFDGIEPTTLTFGPGFNVLLGKNASGKTTLLDIIAAILADNLEIVASRSREIALSFELSGGEEVLMVDFAAQAPASVLEGLNASSADVADVGTIRDVRVSARMGAGTLEYSTREGVVIDGQRAPALERAPSRIGWRPRLLFSLKRKVGRIPWWSPSNRLGRLDEALSVWTRWFGGAGLETLQVIIDRGGSITVNAPSVLHELAPVIEDLLGAGPVEEPPPQISVEVSALRPFAEILGLFDLPSATITFRLREAISDDEGIGAEYSNPELTLKRRDGSVVRAEWLSFGQKRLLTFLLYDHETRDLPAVLDELVNGLHYDWVELCMDKLRDRQSFLAAQNPLILDLLGFASAEEVRSTFIQCARVPGEKGRDRMKWTNFTEEQANEFYDAYAVGIQHVHEVLKSKGLW